jgi:hypothetical protein
MSLLIKPGSCECPACMRAPVPNTSLEDSEDAFYAALKATRPDFVSEGSGYYSVPRVAAMLDILPCVLRSWTRTEWPDNSLMAGFQYDVRYDVRYDRRRTPHISATSILFLRKLLKHHPILPATIRGSVKLRHGLRPG